MKKFIFVALLIFLAACSGKTEDFRFDHIHGVGFHPDGNKIYAAVHQQLLVYEDGKWNTVDGNAHDYMGFNIVDDGFYSSGHPQRGSGLKDPLGIVKNKDFSASLNVLGLHGEADFHLMAVGYRHHGIHVYNSHPNSVMDTIGLYYSDDDAKSWKAGAMEGIEGTPYLMSVHPEKPSEIAVATETGVYVSKDYGNRFRAVLPDTPVSALNYGPSGALFVGTYEDHKAGLRVFNDLETKEWQTIQLPRLSENDAVIHVGQHPQRAEALVIATGLNDIYQRETSESEWSVLYRSPDKEHTSSTHQH